MAEVESLRETRAQKWRAVVGGLLGIVLGVALTQSKFRYTSPRGVLFIVSMLVVVELLGGVFNLVKNARAGRFRPLPRGSRLSLQGILVWRLALAGVAYLMWEYRGWTPRDVGLSPISRPALWFVAGFCLYIPMTAVFTAIRFPKGLGRGEYRDWFHAMHAVVPRARPEWTKVWWIVLLNPFTEEFMYRGVLVYMASSRGTPVPLAVICGAVLCAIGHLYQGPKGLWFHLTFYAVAVALLFSPGGLWAAFGFHLAGDVIPTWNVARNFRQLRAKRCPAPSVASSKAAA